ISCHNTKIECDDHSKCLNPFACSNNEKNKIITLQDEKKFIYKYKKIRLPASSSILYRTKCINFNKIPPHLMGHLDIYLLFLEKGSIFYINENLSVYNCKNPASIYNAMINKSAGHRLWREIMSIMHFRKMYNYFSGDIKTFILILAQKKKYTSWKTLLINKRDHVTALSKDKNRIELYSKRLYLRMNILNKISTHLFKKNKIYDLKNYRPYIYLKNIPSSSLYDRIAVSKKTFYHLVINLLAKIMFLRSPFKKGKRDYENC
ncbi:hypothetical protein, partial [Mailhella sp.]